LTTSPPAAAPTASASYAADLAAIAAFNVKYLKAINDGDITALSSLTDDDHIALPPGSAPLVGKAANVAVNGRIYQQSRIDEHWTPIETVIDGNLAYQRGSFTASATPKTTGGTARAISGSFLRIYRRQPDGSWVMTRDMFNSGPPDSPAH
jgi:ketosteroid isomerase-like protein